MISYDPKDASKAWDKGEYEATLVNVEEKTSQTSGKPMEQWTIEVYNAEGNKQTIKEYVVVPGATFKIKQLAEAMGKSDDFAAGRFQAEDHIGASFLVDLAVEEGRDGFPDKNRINRFKAPKPSAPAPAQFGRDRITNRPKPEDPRSKEPVFTADQVPF